LANIFSPFGFRYHGLYGDQAPPTSGLIQMKITAGNTNVFGEGDPLKFLATGYVDAFSNATTATLLAGVFKSVEYYSTAFGRRVWSNYWPGSGVAGDALVSVIPCQGSIAPRFLVSSSGATAVTMGNVGYNTDILSGTQTGTYSGGFYKSTCSIDTVANFAVTNTKPWRIVQLYSDIAPHGANGADNSAYNWVLVEPNNSIITGI
jgi:hypothetical protein